VKKRHSCWGGTGGGRGPKIGTLRGLCVIVAPRTGGETSKSKMACNATVVKEERKKKKKKCEVLNKMVPSSRTHKGKENSQKEQHHCRWMDLGSGGGKSAGPGGEGLLEMGGTQKSKGILERL